MIVQVPDNQLYGSALISGWTQSGSSETLRLAVVLKAAYLIVPDGAGGRVLEPTKDETDVQIIYEDVGAFKYTTPADEIEIIPPSSFGTVEVDEDDNVTPPEFAPSNKGEAFFEFDGSNFLVDGLTAAHKFEFDLEYEADIAIEKARTDIVVKGFVSDTGDGALQVDGDAWLRRAAPPEHTIDETKNLFGLQPKTENGRSLANTNFTFTDENRLPSNFSSEFNNFYRRSTGYSTPDNRVADPLSSHALVEIFGVADPDRNATPPDVPSYIFTLPDLNRAARYRFHDGTLPDHEHCWRTAEIGPMRADTLIVAPDNDRATVLWRASWSANEKPLDSYRRVEITQEAN